MSDKRFDDILKAKMDGHEVPFHHTHWEQMQELLSDNSTVPPVSMEDQFDQLLKGKLEKHTVMYNEDSWLNLQSVLENNSSDAEVDHEVRSRLKDHTVEFVESHWQILKAKLELEKELKTKIFWTKASEVVIIGLLIFSYIHMSPYLKTSSKHEDSQTESIDAASHNAPMALKDTADKTSKKLAQNRSISSQKEKVKLLPTIFGSHNEGSSTLLLRANTRTASAIDPNIVGTEQTSNTEINDDQIQSNPINLPTNLLQEDLNIESKFPENFKNISADALHQTVILKESDAEDRAQASSNKNKANHIGADVVAFSNIESSLIAYHNDLNTLESRHNEVTTTPMMVKVPAKNEKWIGISSGADLNIIKTPIDIDFIKVPRDFLTLSLTNGVNYGVTKGKNEFFTGVYYSVKIYDPNIKEQLEVNKSYYVRDHVQEKFKILHLPFQYRRHIGDPNKLHVYLAGGLAINSVMYSEYTYDDQLKRGDPRSDYALNRAARYRQSDFHKGLLDGGHFKHNLYLTAQAGIGIEKRINRMKIFFDAMYKKNLLSTRLGPRNVQLNSISLNVGTRYKI